MGAVKLGNLLLKSIGISMVGSERGARGASIDIILTNTAVSGGEGGAGGGSRARNQANGISLSTLFGSGGSGGATGSSKSGNHPIGIALSVAAISF